MDCKTTALVFPGQGSHYIGMGKAFYDHFLEAKEVFQEVDETLNQSLSSLIFSGNMDELTKTENTQPALMCVSIAILRVIEKQLGTDLSSMACYVAGHSVGEYTANCAARSISLADTASLVRTRGKAMQQAVPLGKGGMLALIGGTSEEVQALIDEASSFGVCEMANDNGGGQVVISGTIEAMEAAEKLAKEFGFKRAVRLPVSAPFHSSMMKPAQKVMAEAFEEVPVLPPLLPIIANITAQPVTAANEIADLLIDQVAGPVRWRESVEFMAKEGITHVIEIGAGKVLSGLVRRIAPEIKALHVDQPSDMDQLLTTNY